MIERVWKSSDSIIQLLRWRLFKPWLPIVHSSPIFFPFFLNDAYVYIWAASPMWLWDIIMCCEYIDIIITIWGPVIRYTQLHVNHTIAMRAYLIKERWSKNVDQRTLIKERWDKTFYQCKVCKQINFTNSTLLKQRSHLTIHLQIRIGMFWSISMRYSYQMMNYRALLQRINQ